MPKTDTVPTKPPGGKASTRNKIRDPDVRERIETALRAGAYREQAALHGGISVSTFYRWMKEGEAAHDAGIPIAESPHRQLWEAVQNAEASGELHLLAIIKEQAPKSWQAAAWILERKYPNKWGRFDRVEHSGKVIVPDVAVPASDVARVEIAKILAEAGALG